MKKDKRKNPRYPCRVPVMCKKGTFFDCSQTMDISPGGVGFVCERFVPVDTKMAVELSFSDDVDPELTFAKVKWIKPLPNIKGYRLGLNFIGIASKVRSRLKKNFC